jgi:hypothetical protein
MGNFTVSKDDYRKRLIFLSIQDAEAGQPDKGEGTEIRSEVSIF